MRLDNPAFVQALADVEVLNIPNKQWAELEVLTWPNGTYKMSLSYGTIHANGEHEIAICTRDYSMRGDKVVVTSYTHY